MIVLLIFLLFLLFLLFRNEWVLSTRLEFADKCSEDIYDTLASYPIMLFSVWNWSQDPKDWVKNI